MPLTTPVGRRKFQPPMDPGFGRGLDLERKHGAAWLGVDGEWMAGEQA